MMLLLAQVNNPLIVADPPPLPAAPLLERLLFENPFLLPTAVLLLVVISPWVLGGLPKKTARVVQLVLVLVLAAAVVLPRAVVTQRERLSSRVMDMVRAVAAANAVRLDELLGPDAALYYFMAPEGLPRARIIESVRTDFADGGAYHTHDVAILETQAVLDTETTGRVQIKVRVVPEVTGIPNLSWWLVEMRREGEGPWRAEGISPLAISGVANASGR